MTHSGEAIEIPSRGTLCAILLNPSFNASETTSHSNLAVAVSALGFSSFQIVNLIQTPSRNSKELAPQAVDQTEWFSARMAIAEALASADEVVFAWGSSRLHGPANRHKVDQINWVVQQALIAGHSNVIMMDGSPRHPSRWRQYVGPQKMRVVGNTLEDRFRLVLNRHPLEVDHDFARQKNSTASESLNERSVDDDHTSLLIPGRRTS